MHSSQNALAVAVKLYINVIFRRQVRHRKNVAYPGENVKILKIKVFVTIISQEECEFSVAVIHTFADRWLDN